MGVCGKRKGVGKRIAFEYVRWEICKRKGVWGRG